MTSRAVLIVAVAVVLAGAAGGGAWWRLRPAPPEIEQLADDDAPLPVPPVPPRIAEGEDYEKCLAMLSDDPAGAQTFAEGWGKQGGGEGAVHCSALARIALGDPATGATMLQRLADGSQNTPVARASVYSQAGQAFLMADDDEGALGAATLALVLSPDDADLLIDRAVAAAGLKRYQDAIDDLTRALDIDGSRADAMVLRGSAWRHMGRLELAADDIDRALAADGDNAEALLERGILRQRQNDRKGARSDWQRAVDLAPDTATADLAQQNLALLDAGPDRR